MKYIRIITAVIILLLVCAAAFIVAAYNFNTSPGTIGEDDYFRISRGENGTRIATRLQEEGFIKSAQAFSIYSRVTGTGGQMKTGYYRIPAGASMKEIHDLLLQGRQVLYSLTVPEGWTLRNIGDELEKIGITSAADFIQAAESGVAIGEYGIEAETSEGFLYPDTYSFPLDFPSEKVVTAMVNNFFEKLGEITDYSSMVSGDLYSKIILASIVEKEYRVADEAAMIASVFYNRLNIDMPLQSCASVVYIITELQGKEHPDTIYYSDLEIDSDYNTYIHEGLPPAPIANPGFTALNAVFNPEDSEYFYFLLKDANAGRHIFSKTYGEHNQAYSLYIKKD